MTGEIGFYIVAGIISIFSLAVAYFMPKILDSKK